MKVCLINNLYPPFARGGAERVVELMTAELKQQQHNVFIITTRPYFKKENLHSRVYYLPSWFPNLARLPVGLRLFWHLLDMFDLGSFFRVRAILKNEKPDLVITHNLKGISFLIPRLIFYLKIKHIHILHDIQLLHPSGLLFFGQENVLDSWPAKIYIHLNKILFKPVPTVISPSKWLLDEHQKRGFFKGAQTRVLSNPIVLGDIKLQPKNKEQRFSFVFIGHLNKAKGINLLLKAYWILTKKKGLRVKLFIAGKGEEKKVIEKAAANDDNLVYLGYLTRERLNKFLVQADCLVVPSLCYENSPTVVYEAVTFGLPFIVSRLGGAAELAKEFGGLSFVPISEENLARIMEQAIKNSDYLKKVAARNREKIKKYSVDFYIQQCLRLMK